MNAPYAKSTIESAKWIYYQENKIDVRQKMSNADLSKEMHDVKQTCIPYQMVKAATDEMFNDEIDVVKQIYIYAAFRKAQQKLNADL